MDSAVEHYRQAAEAYAREGMYDNAIACCKKIRRHEPQNDQASLLLGRFYGAKGLRADAARELESFAERQDREGRRKEAILALAELARIAPDRPLVRERLARLYAENGQRDAALEEYRAARAEYLARGDRDGARRIEDALAEHGERPPRPVAAEPAPDRPEPIRPAEPDDPVAAGERPPIPLGLEIEHTSYADRRDGRVEAPEVAEPVGSTDTAQLVASAEGAAAAGDVDAAAARLLDAAEGLRAQRRWEDAVEAYRSLAGLGRARDDEYAAWTESARQAGMASLVLEALSAQARWHLAAGRRSSARKAAEEMLLVDPKNDVAAGILSQVGSTLPRD